MFAGKKVITSLDRILDPTILAPDEHTAFRLGDRARCYGL